jgi:hypothetical protein
VRGSELNREHANRRPSRHIVVNQRTDKLEEKIQFEPVCTDGGAIYMKFCTVFKRDVGVGSTGQAPLTEYWTDFESENGFEKVLPLATILVQDFIAQLYSLTPQGPIRTNPDPR